MTTQNTDPAHEEWLIKQTLGGDQGAFADLVQIYYRRIRALGMGFFKNVTDTEDYIQEVFLKMYTKLATFRGESRFSTWCTRLAYNVGINTVNRRKEYATIADEESLLTDNLGPEELEMRKITGEAVKKVVKELPQEYAICIDLYFFHDMAYKEISCITDLPVNTIKSHIFRAKKLLRDKLVDYYSDH
jgi:RNA polymerase sigma-70 factor (ECF subfamily)